MALRKLNLVGQVFSELTVIAEVEQGANYLRRYRCKCSCGNETIVGQAHLRRGSTTSCGCIQKQRLEENRTSHKQAHTKLYKVWTQMKQRCQNKKDSSYPNYGAKGITVCAEWQTFEPFYAWAMEANYVAGLTIERIEVSQGYSPSNCMFIPLAKQAINKGISVRNSSGYSGVSFNKSKGIWVARVTVEGERKEVAKCSSALDAHLAKGRYLKNNNLTVLWEVYARQCKAYGLPMPA